MANYTAADVKALRDRSGAGMMDCKGALDEADGNVDKALEFLRLKGLKGVTKREGRTTSNGLIVARVSGGTGTLIELACETDFVAKNADFVAFAQAIADKAVETGVSSIDELTAQELNGAKIADLIIDQTGKIGEKIGVSKFETISADKVVAYIHGNYRLAVLVGFNQDVDGLDEAGKDVAMQIAAMSPVGVDKADVDVSNVREIFVMNIAQ
mgnify:CR=1 FL=1